LGNPKVSKTRRTPLRPLKRWRLSTRLGHEIGFGIGIAHGFATLGTIGFEGRFDYAAIGTVSNVAEHREPCESRGSCTVLGARGRRKGGPSLAQHRQARTRLDKGRPRFCGALSQQDDLV
jgi:hypothetical protein